MQLVHSIASVRRVLEERRREENIALGVTIGNFDGMHLGHQHLFQNLESGIQSIAAESNSVPVRVLLTFQPHPRRVLSGLSRRELREQKLYWSLGSFRQKHAIAKKFGFDYFVVVHFSKAFAAISPIEFLQAYLVDALRADLVLVGHDWAFGKDKCGDAEFLKAFAADNNIAVEVMEPVPLSRPDKPASQRISSSGVREALGAGDLESLRGLLGRNYEISSKVIHGAGRGRRLGFPTANLRPVMQLLPKLGVYAALVHFDHFVVPAVTNVGVRPTFDQESDGIEEPLVEVHLLSKAKYNLYRKRIRVEFVARLRDEKRFSDVEALKMAIDADIARTKKLLSI